ncbi:hypothetical protein [uncultured Helicobacter sp.]
MQPLVRHSELGAQILQAHLLCLQLHHPKRANAQNPHNDNH